MKVCKDKLELALARECRNISSLRSEHIHPRVLSRIMNEPEYQPTPRMVGKIAKALNCDVTEIVEE